jgi:RNA polymerase sigma-70 factor (ECF subfamily)
MKGEMSGQKDVSDQELMDGLQSGDISRLGVLYDRHAPGVLRHCHRMLGDEEAARDLTHEIFLRIFRYRMSWRGRSRFTTWLYRITHNACLDWIDRENRRREAAGETGVDGIDAGDRTVSDAGTSLERREAGRLLEQALERLSPPQREIILLIRFREVSYEEAGRMLDCTVNAARVRFHRAVKALREEYLNLERTNG